MQNTEKSNTESKQKYNYSSFSFDKCQDMAGMMESCGGGSNEDPIDFKKMIQNMFVSSSKEEKQN